jgi:hypothetical protein
MSVIDSYYAQRDLPSELWELVPNVLTPAECDQLCALPSPPRMFAGAERKSVSATDALDRDTFAAPNTTASKDEKHRNGSSTGYSITLPGGPGAGRLPALRAREELWHLESSRDAGVR